MTRVGRFLRRRRRELDLTQEQLALATGMMQGGISFIERGGIKNPSWRTMVLLADALQLTLPELREAIGPERYIPQ